MPAPGVHRTPLRHVFCGTWVKNKQAPCRRDTALARLWQYPVLPFYGMRRVMCKRRQAAHLGRSRRRAGAPSHHGARHSTGARCTVANLYGHCQTGGTGLAPTPVAVVSDATAKTA